jgi:PKD repeat protein
MTRFWVDNKELFKKYEKHLMINIANEWGPTTYKGGECELWRDTYKEAITTLRAAGIKVPLVIDAPDWGHRIDCGSEYGQELLDHDPLKSIIFSVHYYCPGWGGATATDIKRHMKEFSDKKLAYLVGEYGEQESCQGQIEKDTIVKYAHEYGFGHYWFAWWCSYWSAASSYGTKTKDDLTTDGRWLIYDNPYAIFKTATPASVFGAPGPLASISASPPSGSAPLVVNFDASASRGENLSYSWLFSDNSRSSGKTVSHTFSEKGAHTVSLSVTNANGSNQASMTINVFAPGTCKLSGTIIGTDGSWNNNGSTREKAFDGNTNTFFDSPSPNGSWVGLDLGKGNESRVSLIRFYPRTNYNDRMAGGLFQGASSATFSNPVELHRINGIPLQQWHEIEINKTTQFRYIRYLSPDNGGGNVAEMEFYGSCTPTSVQIPSLQPQSHTSREGEVRVFTLQGRMVPPGLKPLSGAQVILLPDGRTVTSVHLGRTVPKQITP